MNAELIDLYEAGGSKLRQAVSHLTREDLLWKPDARDAELGKWSIQQVVMHLLDSDLIGIDRMKRIIAMDNPQITGYDETRFAERLMYEEQSVDDAIRILDLSFRNFGRVLRKLPDSVFNRTGTHSERGVIRLGDYLQFMVNHLDHHVKFIHAKRARMGKEMW